MGEAWVFVVDMRENTARDIWRRPKQGEKAVNMASRLDQAMRCARKGGGQEGGGRREDGKGAQKAHGWHGRLYRNEELGEGKPTSGLGRGGVRRAERRAWRPADTSVCE